MESLWPLTDLQLAEVNNQPSLKLLIFTEFFIISYTKYTGKHATSSHENLMCTICSKYFVSSEECTAITTRRFIPANI